MALATAILGFTSKARANVYATDIKLNGSLTGAASISGGNTLTITYILNEAATAGATIKILSGATVVNSISIASGNPGTAHGLNTVVCGATNNLGANLATGSYSVSITAAATGFSSWTQTSVDGANTAAVYPHGMDVDRNTNSPYYGRVVVGNNVSASAHGVSQKVGLYKFNADGSPADEGSFGYANYTTNDSGSTATGQMPSGGEAFHGLLNPLIIRIGEDDRIYWVDNSYKGAIVASDILATTNQVVICEGPGNAGTGLAASVAFPNSPNNYSGNPDGGDLDQAGQGIGQFDVCSANTTNAALYLCDTGDYPSWGVWMFHMTNGASDPADTEGTQAVATGGDLAFVTGAGLMVDDNLDIFVSQSRQNASDTANRVFAFTNWNGGVLPGEGQGFNFSEATGSEWAVGANDDYETAIIDTVVNSRINPTMVAVCMVDGAPVAGGYSGANGGIRVLDANTGATIVTNLDIANWYPCCAFDNVGNVYGASTSANYWRVWSPPGANTATTVAVATMSVSASVTQPVISSISVNGGTVTIKFTGGTSDSPSAFALLGASSVTPASGYSAVPGASITQLSPGVFQATAATSGSTHFYRIKR